MSIKSNLSSEAAAVVKHAPAWLDCHARLHWSGEMPLAHQLRSLAFSLLERRWRSNRLWPKLGENGVWQDHPDFRTSHPDARGFNAVLGLDSTRSLSLPWSSGKPGQGVSLSVNVDIDNLARESLVLVLDFRPLIRRYKNLESAKARVNGIDFFDRSMKSLHNSRWVCRLKTRSESIFWGAWLPLDAAHIDLRALSEGDSDAFVEFDDDIDFFYDLHAKLDSDDRGG
jgi:hypothetical protein